jgi:hypothetical protein
MLTALMLTAFCTWAVPAGWVDGVLTRRVVQVERAVVVELAVRTGDPLGSRAEGNLKTLSEPKLVVGHKKTGTARAGGQQAVLGAEGELKMEPVGITVEVTPVLRLDGKIYLEGVITETEVNAGRGVRTPKGFTPGIDTKSIRLGALLTPGQKIKVRVSSRSDADQTWVEFAATVQEPAGVVVK